MSRPVFPMWLFGLALAIALVAFGLAQIRPGAGMMVVAGAAALWTAFVVRRGRRAVR